MLMNKGTKLGFILGGIGGIVAFIAMAVNFETTLESGTTMGALLLIAAMFFALSGAFSKNGQWTPKALSFFGFFTLAVIVACLIAGIIGIYFGVIEIVILALIIVISYGSATQRFISQN